MSEGPTIIPDPAHSFLNNLINQPDISHLLNSNYRQHQTTVIQHDLDTLEHQDGLINQLINANPLTITTHNTRNLSDTTKFAQLLETLTLHKVDICGVTETGHTTGQKYKTKQHPEFAAYWSTSVNRYAGVGLIIHRKWCTYIQSTYLQSDRFIYVDLFFKGHIKVRIIVIYLHADPTTRMQRQTLQAQIIDLLKSSQKEHYHTIIMGDFNANLERFYNSVSKHNQGNWQYAIFHYLQQNQFSDLHRLYSTDQAHSGYTFILPQNGAVSRIDAIFTSPNFPFASLYCHTRKFFLYLSDHLIVAAYFQPIESKQAQQEKRLRTRCKVYNVQKMEKDDWQNFSTYSDKYYHDHNFKQYEQLPANRHSLNLLWTKIKEVLVTTTNKTVPCSFRSSENRLPKSKSLTSCYTALKKMNHLLLKFCTKLISQSIWPDEHEWAQLSEMVQQIIKEHHLESVVLPTIITMNNVRPLKRQLLTIYKLIYHKVRLEQRHLEQVQMQHNIKLRCFNYEEDLTRMIDSILNRDRRRIVLDRLLVNDPLHGKVLITDPKTIQTHAAQHFQQYALSQNTSPSMNE